MKRIKAWFVECVVCGDYLIGLKQKEVKQKLQDEEWEKKKNEYFCRTCWEGENPELLESK